MVGRRRLKVALGVASLATIATATGIGAAQTPGAAWPHVGSPLPADPAMEKRIDALLAKMSVEDKVAQVVQPDIGSLTMDDIRQYKFGSILAGGSSGPNLDDKAPAPAWLAYADAAWDAVTKRGDGRPVIPPIWGIDAVHGHANIIGATIFPQNIGLGAMRDRDLIRKIGEVTAKEMAVTGIDWDFSPTLAVVRDDRWGRSYEGFSEDPSVVHDYAGAMIEGLQGKAGTKEFLRDGKVIATAKHFVGDGGTANGIDQGDNPDTPERIRDIHGAGYPPAIAAGVQAVMASFSSVRGTKLSADKDLLTGALRDQMGFDGLTVGDWNAHGQVPGCTNTSCPAAINAGMDMVMAPDSWKGFYASTLAQVKSGEISTTRLDEAVRRILRVKIRAGMFEKGKPSSRPFAGKFELLGSPEHRAVARQAVRESLVLLKNQGHVLPLSPKLDLLVAGDGADNISKQSGGWTISWQGTGVTNADFPGATSLWKGLSDAVNAAGGSAELSPDGSFKVKPDAAVVIFGEKPYAEFQGDRKSLQLDPELAAPFETMRKLKAQGIPVVAVMITGRPLYVNPALNLADAFVVTWLPGSEGQGLADVLVGNKAGGQRFDFTGTLPTVWPKTANMADGVLYPFGFGLKYSAPRSAWTKLPENTGTAAAGDSRVWFTNGVPSASWSLVVADAAGAQQTRITTVPAKALDGRVTVTATDHVVQEGARRFVVDSGSASIQLGTFDPLDIARESNGDVMLLVTARIDKAPGKASIGMRGGAAGAVPVTLPVNRNYVRYGIQLKCFAAKGVDMTKVTAPFVLTLEGAADVSLAEVRLGSDAEVVLGCGA